MKQTGIVLFALIFFFLSVDAGAARVTVFDSKKQNATTDEDCTLSCKGYAGTSMKECMKNCSKTPKS